MQDSSPDLIRQDARLSVAATGRPLRIGAIGAGWWASSNHFPWLSARPDVDLAVLAEPDPTRRAQAAERFGFPDVCADHRELLEYDLDAVVVASPHHLHHLHTAAALDAGIAVLCEKPMALTAADAWDLVDRSRRSGAPLVVGYGWNHKPFLNRAKALMQCPGVGRIEHVAVRMASPTKDFFSTAAATVPSQFAPVLAGPDPATWQDPERGGGYVHGQLTHAAGLALWLTGLRARTVTALLSGPGAPVELYVSALVRYDNEAHGVFAGSGTLPDDDKFQVDVAVFGSQGALLVDVERERVELRRHDGAHQGLAVDPGAGAYSCEGPLETLLALARDRDADNPAPGELGARVVELLEAVGRSAADPAGPWVPIDPGIGPREDGPAGQDAR